jgi:predicted metal-dependent hydrolase
VPKLPDWGASLDRRTKTELLGRLEQDALQICARFRLRYRALEAERANVKRRYGVCYSDGTIRIRLRHATSGRPLKYSSLVNTLCHELAHLKHFNHGPRFQTFYSQILEWARRERIYQPRKPKAPGERAAVATITPSAQPLQVVSLAQAETASHVRRKHAPAAQLELFG